MGSEPGAHVLTEFLGQCVARLDAGAEHHEGLGHLALALVGHTDHRGHGHRVVRAEATLDLTGADAIPGRLDHVVLARHEPEVAVFVLNPEVSGQQPVADELLLGRLRVLPVFEEREGMVPVGGDLPFLAHEPIALVVDDGHDRAR